MWYNLVERSPFFLKSQCLERIEKSGHGVILKIQTLDIE